MECEAIKLVTPSTDGVEKEMVRIKNSLSINFVAQTLLEKEKLNPQVREELKESIIERIDRELIPNFTN